MNKHITTAMALIALSVPALGFAQTGPAAAKPTRPTVQTTQGTTVGNPLKERIGNVIFALKNHEMLLDTALTKIADQSAKFKQEGGDVSGAEATLGSARTKLAEVKSDIASLENMLNTVDLKDKTKTAAIRDGVAKTITAIRATRDLLIESIQKLKAVTVNRPMETTPTAKP